MKPERSQNAARKERSRSLRKQQTKSEGLLWSLLRNRQLCGLKFRRQHPISPYFADFACVARRLVVEVDGGYHDFVGEEDKKRQEYLRECGWSIIRFSDQEVEEDVENVCRAIAKHLGLEYSFKIRDGRGSGMLHRSESKPPENNI